MLETWGSRKSANPWEGINVEFWFEQKERIRRFCISCGQYYLQLDDSGFVWCQRKIEQHIFLNTLGIHFLIGFHSGKWITRDSEGSIERRRAAIFGSSVIHYSFYSCSDIEKSSSFSSYIDKYEGLVQKCTELVIAVSDDVKNRECSKTQRCVDMNRESSPLQMIENRGLKRLQNGVLWLEIFLRCL